MAVSSSCKTEQNPLSLLLPSHPEFVPHEGARASQPFLCHTCTHDHILPELDSSDEARPEDHWSLHLQGLWDGGELVGARESSTAVVVSLQPCTSPVPHCTRPHPSHEDPLPAPDPNTDVHLYLPMDTGPRPYLSREGGQGLLHTSFYVSLPFCTSTFPPRSCPSLSALPVSLSL